jgi:acetyltransferase EpsM
MVTKKVVIWGASGHSRVVADILRLRSDYEIAGFLDDVNSQAQGRPFCGSRILGGREELSKLVESGVRWLIFGFGACGPRLRLASVVRHHGLMLLTATHPNAVIASDVAIGEGTVIAAGAVINTGARLGDNVIVNTGASVDHDCTIGDAAHICPGVHLAGGVRVDASSWVGIGTAVTAGVTIGPGAIIGAGSLVIDDIPPNVVAFGSPATVRRSVREDDREIAG